ncbi:hypothetical protein Q1695_009592 [Nippostrongylus brasiliensis]|nr:hypothetical protein Q1695_009592 [Nippostrongylus brasiliensis]
MRRRQQRQPFKAQYYELSYVQINIYNTNMKALRREGVNLNKLLRSVAHRSVIMEIPIVSGKRRPQQSVKNTRRADVSKSLPTPQSEPMAGNQSIRLTPGREENVMEMMDLIIEDELPPSPTALIHEETGHLRKLSQSPVEALSVSKLIHSNCSRRDCEAKITYTAEQLSQQLCCSLQPTLTDDYAKNLYERAVELNAAGTNLTNGCSGNELVVQKVEATPLESVLAATSAVALEKKVHCYSGTLSIQNQATYSGCFQYR